MIVMIKVPSQRDDTSKWYEFGTVVRRAWYSQEYSSDWVEADITTQWVIPAPLHPEVIYGFTHTFTHTAPSSPHRYRHTYT